MSITRLVYKEIAPGADLDATVATDSASPFSTPAQLPFGQGWQPTITGEQNQWGLTGEYVGVDSQSPAFWSVEMSGGDCLFASQPQIVVTFSQQHSSPGITLMFDRATGGYCDKVNIRWYQQSALKSDMDFTPDGAEYFCQNPVTSYDKVILTFVRTNLPYRYAKIERIIFGVYRYFGMTELRNVSAVNQTHLISLELPVSTLDWGLTSKENIEYMFQTKQPVEAYNNDRLIGVYYIDTYIRTAKNVYDIDCHGAWGVLDSAPFAGGVYTSQSAKNLISGILLPEFQVEFADDLADINLTGVILSGTRREAAQQVLFAWGVCGVVVEGETVRVFRPNNNTQEILPNRTYSGSQMNVDALVTEVRVTAHTYTQSANGSVEIGGVKYNDAKTVYSVTNPDVTATDKQNVIEVNGGTLVSPAIGQATAQRIYNYYKRRSDMQAKFVWRGELLGDCVSVTPPWGDIITGHIEKMDVALSNLVAAECSIKGV